MSTAQPLPEQPDYFGICPRCQGNPVYANVGRNHWAYCSACSVKWCIGSNLLSAWTTQSEETWRVNAEFLERFETVKPAQPPSAESTKGDNRPLPAYMRPELEELIGKLQELVRRAYYEQPIPF